MSLFFSGAVTSSPVKRRPRRNRCQSLDASFLSPDSSYVCYSSADAGSSCCCRRSPRLLTNGYYEVTEDSFLLDEDGNVSLLGCRTNVSYKENLVRVFRRRRRPRGSLARLLSGVTETCQSWLDQKVFGGVFGTRQNQDLDWTQSEQAGPTLLDESSWSDLSGAELNDGCSFTYGGCPVRTRFSWVHQGPVHIISFLLQIPLKSRLLSTKMLRLQRRSYRRRFAQRSANQRSLWAGSLKSRLLHLSTPTAAAARRHLSPQD